MVFAVQKPGIKERNLRCCLFIVGDSVIAEIQFHFLLFSHFILIMEVYDSHVETLFLYHPASSYIIIFFISFLSFPSSIHLSLLLFISLETCL